MLRPHERKDEILKYYTMSITVSDILSSVCLSVSLLDGVFTDGWRCLSVAAMVYFTPSCVCADVTKAILCPVSCSSGQGSC